MFIRFGDGLKEPPFSGRAVSPVTSRGSPWKGDVPEPAAPGGLSYCKNAPEASPCPLRFPYAERLLLFVALGRKRFRSPTWFLTATIPNRLGHSKRTSIRHARSISVPCQSAGDLGKRPPTGRYLHEPAGISAAFARDKKATLIFYCANRLCTASLISSPAHREPLALITAGGILRMDA